MKMFKFCESAKFILKPLEVIAVWPCPDREDVMVVLFFGGQTAFVHVEPDSRGDAIREIASLLCQDDSEEVSGG